MGYRFRWFGVVILLGLVVAGGAFGYNLGLARGLAQAAPVAVAPGGAPPLVYYPYPWHWGWGFGFSPLFGLLWLFLVFAMIRRLFWGWGGWRRGYGRHRGFRGIPPEFDEWHRRAHGRQAPGPEPTNL